MKNTIRIEQWNVAGPKGKADKRQVVDKVAVRNERGQFNGATNFKGSVLRG